MVPVLLLTGFLGSGKTTLLKLLAGIYAPTGGAIFLEGRPLQGYETNSYLDRVYMWGLGSSVHPLTARENIALCRLSDKDNDARVVAAAESAGAGGLDHGLETIESAIRAA